VNAVRACDQVRVVRIEKLHPERDATERGHRFDGARTVLESLVEAGFVEARGIRKAFRGSFSNRAEINALY
jgi:hypothetical protein